MTSSIPENGVVVTSYTVMPEWLDYNNHMNVAYYVGTFDLGIDALKAIYGMDADYIKLKQRSTVALEAHVTYQNEASLGEKLSVHSRVLDFDAKRTHLYQEMHRGGDLLATQETLSISFDLEKRKSCPFEDAIARQITILHAAQLSLPRPSWIGAKIGIRRTA